MEIERKMSRQDRLSKLREWYASGALGFVHKVQLARHWLISRKQLYEDLSEVGYRPPVAQFVDPVIEKREDLPGKIKTNNTGVTPLVLTVEPSEKSLITLTAPIEEPVKQLDPFNPPPPKADPNEGCMGCIEPEPPYYCPLCQKDHPAHSICWEKIKRSRGHIIG